MKNGAIHIVIKLGFFALAILLTIAINTNVQNRMQKSSEQVATHQITNPTTHTDGSTSTTENNENEENYLEYDICIILDSNTKSLLSSTFKTSCFVFTPRWENIVMEINPFPPTALSI